MLQLCTTPTEATKPHGLPTQAWHYCDLQLGQAQTQAARHSATVGKPCWPKLKHTHAHNARQNGITASATLPPKQLLGLRCTELTRPVVCLGTSQLDIPPVPEGGRNQQPLTVSTAVRKIHKHVRHIYESVGQAGLLSDTTVCLQPGPTRAQCMQLRCAVGQHHW